MAIGESSTRIKRRTILVWALIAAALAVVVAVSMSSSDMVRAEWRLASDLEPTESMLPIEVVLDNSCQQVKTVAVGYLEDVVRVDAFVVDLPLAAPRRCEPTDRTELVRVGLAEPLGERQVFGCVTTEQLRACGLP